MSDSPIQSVGDTAFMIAAFRAMEDARPDALVRDPFAARLAGEEGRAIAARIPRTMFLQWSVPLRTVLVDRFVRQAIADGAEAVLNLGAGLDARPYRMDLPASFRWIEADSPRIFDIKEQRVGDARPVCRLERLRVDLTEPKARRELLASVASAAKKVFVLTEGVVPYLTLEQTAALADELRAWPSMFRWAVDYQGARVHEFRRKEPVASLMAHAPFRFEPPDYFGFFAEHGWRAREVHYLPDVGDALGRPFPLPPVLRWWLRLIGPLIPPEKKKGFRELMGFVLFEPA